MIGAFDAYLGVAKGSVHEGAVVRSPRVRMDIWPKVNTGHTHSGNRDPPLLLKLPDESDRDSKQGLLVFEWERVDGLSHEVGPHGHLGG